MIYFENRVGVQFHVKTTKQKTSNADRTNINLDRIENFFCFLQLFCIPYLPSMYRLQVFRNSFLEVCRIWWHWEIFCQTFCWVFSFAAICRFPLSGCQLLLVWGLPSNILKTHYSREPVKSEWAGSWHTRNWFGELAVTWLLWILFVFVCVESFGDNDLTCQMQGSLGNKRMLFLGEGAFLAHHKQIQQSVLSCAAAVQSSRELATVLECIFLHCLRSFFCLFLYPCLFSYLILKFY